jgi:ureidoglycolate hydrolase
MDESLIEIRDYAGAGYQPLVDFASWRVAIMRDSEPYAQEKIERVERHVETDEVFVLLAGQVTLFVGDGEARAERLVPQVMEPLKLYNVKRNVWHTILFSRDASVLIVENRDTGPQNTEFAALTPEQRRMVAGAVLIEKCFE